MDKQATVNQLSRMAGRNRTRRNLMLIVQMPLLFIQRLIEFAWGIGTVVYIPLVFAYACYNGYHSSEGSFLWGLGVFVFTGFILGLLGEWALNLLHLFARAIHRAGIYTLPKDERAVVLAFLKEQQR